MKRLLFVFLLFLLIFLTAPFVGPKMGDVWNWVFWNLRVPRLLSATLAGGALAISGMVFQAVFRNPLATPFTLGTASGAALGASFLLALTPSGALLFQCFPAISPLVLAAFTGSLGTLAFIYVIVRFSGSTTDSDILLAGVAISFFYSSLIMLLQYLSDPTQTVRMLRWTMGGLDRGGGYGPIWTLIPWILPTAAVLFYHHRELDLFCMGKDVAVSRGVSVTRVRNRLLVTASLLVAAVVSVCGPIGFLGLMVPHIMRRWFGTRHSLLFPAVFMGGAALLILCDTAARTISFPDEIPVGILTALLGGPFFILQILSRRKHRS